METKKTYYSIGEVCTLSSLEPHVLRYWESEFTQLRPKKNRAGNRAYREKDIEVIRYIKHLLYEEKYTIPGAKKKLQSLKEEGDPRMVDTTSIPAIEDGETPHHIVTHHNDTITINESAHAELALPAHGTIKSALAELKDVFEFLKK